MSEISSWTLKDKIYIHARACNILYVSYPVIVHIKQIHKLFIVKLKNDNHEN